MPSERLFLSPPHMSGREQRYLAEAFASNYVAPTGPSLAEFERRFADKVGVDHALAVSSGTAALHLALRHLRIQPGETVLCSSLTFCASANPIVYEGGQPVFVDSEESSWNLDPNLVEEELTRSARLGKLPRAVIAVDIFGQSADLDAILEISSRFDVPVIEDAAEALGATYKGLPAGASAWGSMFSFNGNKIITTSGGGMLCSNDARLIEDARFISSQARDPGAHYQHSQIGFNYRMSNILAAIGLGQLDVLEDRVASRRQIFRWYEARLAALEGISFMPEPAYGKSNRWLTVIEIDPPRYGADRESLRLRLEADNIESRPAWKPLHLQPVFAGCRMLGGKVSERIFDRGLCLPSGSAMTEADVDRVCGHIHELHAESKAGIPLKRAA